MVYFISANEKGLEGRWLVYDRLHFIAFLADILQLLKICQKAFESDIVSILCIPPKKHQLIEKLQNLLTNPLHNGWEQLFLSQVEESTLRFYGHELTKTNPRTRSGNTFFSDQIRNSIIDTLIQNLNERLDYDVSLQDALQPLSSIKPITTRSSLKSCYDAIVPDLDEHQFYADYQKASNLLRNYQFVNPLDTLQKLQVKIPDQLNVLKIALARIVAAKPHSADVERLISNFFPKQYSHKFQINLLFQGDYNKAKTSSRCGLRGLTLFNYLYIKLNMTTVDEFDPTNATNHWLSQKNRHPTETQTRKKQEFFKGVFSEANDQKITNTNKIISF